MKLNFSFIAKIIFINFFLFVGMMEISLRSIKRGSPTYSEYVGLSNSGYYLPSKENTFKLIPNYKGSKKNQDWNLPGEPKSVEVSTDNRGFRSTIEMNEECKLNSFKTFLFLGDSYTFGVYLRDKDTYPSKFQYQSNLLSTSVRYHLRWIFWPDPPFYPCIAVGLHPKYSKPSNRIFRHYKSNYKYPRLVVLLRSDL